MGGVLLSANTPVNGIWSNTTQASGASNYYLVEWDSYYNKWSNTATPFQSEFILYWGGGSNNGPNGVLNTTTTTGRFYTLQIMGLAYANRNAVLMETDAAPQVFHANPAVAVTTPSLVLGGQNVVINISLAGAKSTQEKVFVRYSANGFSSSKVVEAVGVGTNWITASATIPAADIIGGSTIQYYAYSTTVAATDASNHDLISLKLGNNGGSNYSFTVQIPQYQSRAGGSGLWSNPASWDYSLDNGASWTAASSSIPSAANAGKVFIRNGHTMQLDQNLTIDQLEIESGATLVRNGGSSAPLLTLADGPDAADLVIKSNGVLRFQNTNSSFDYVNALSQLGAAKILVESQGVLEVNNSAGSEFWKFATEPITKIEFQHQAVFFYNVIGTLGFGTSGITYFPGVSASVIPVFRIGASVASGANNNTTINGLLEMVSGRTLTWQSSGSKLIRNGISGPGNIIQDNTSGTLIIHGNNSVLGGGLLSLNSSNGMSIDAGVCTMISNKNISSGPVIIKSGATLDANTLALSGTASFHLNTGATLISAHANGVNGNVQLTGTHNVQPFANYVFNGNVNQQTGLLMGTVAYQITIANTGSAGNNIVTLSNNAALPASNSTTTRNLHLNAGLLQVGSGGFLHLEGLESGPVYANITGTGGNLVPGDGGGTLFVKGPANINSTTNGWPGIYNMTIQENGTGLGVNFLSNATINHLFTINQQGYVNPNAPRFATGSTLVYNSGGNYNRSIEWGQPTPLQPGYPHHVGVQNGTTLHLAAVAPSSLEIGGDLTLGNAGSYGVADMNNANIPLVVKGNLTIGTASFINSSLNLSTTFGGDFWLHGNFTRYPNNYYTDNNRAIFFKGTGNSSINTPLAPPATITDPTSQDFSYCIIDKASPSSLVTLNTPTGITQTISFSNGIVQSSSNILVIKNTTPSAIAGGGANSYVNGPLRRNTATSSGNYFFPLGKSGVYKPAHVITTTGQSIGDYFIGELMIGNNSTPTIGSDTYLASVIGISKDYYWQIDRTGTSRAHVALLYNPPGTTWRTADGTILTPCSNCNVAVVKRDATVGPGNWSFTVGSGLFTNSNGLPQARYHADNGLIISGELNVFSPFTIGYSFNTILSTLPVKLQSFTAKMYQADALLEWNIENQDDLLYFEVQHSRNGQSFSSIGKVYPRSDPYNFVYPSLVPGTHFFRLVIHEKNGSHFTSHIQMLNIAATQTTIVGLHHSIESSFVLVQAWSASKQTAEAVLLNALGQPLGRYHHSLQQGGNQWKISTSSLSSGLYFLQIRTTDGAMKTFRFWTK